MSDDKVRYVIHENRADMDERLRREAQNEFSEDAKSCFWTVGFIAALAALVYFMFFH